MKTIFLGILSLSILTMTACTGPVTEEEEAAKPLKESRESRDQRMAWWREARFGLFIHWGLYAIPAGEWKGSTNHAEWIMHTAQIPVEEYEKFVPQFNPVKFDARAWARIAKKAGMKYIVITSKHHDGFCLFDSDYTDYDVMSTPFSRDIMNELSLACQEEGLKMCWYHSIMDWHHPDYLPRRGWENRSAEDADFNSYVEHLKNQVEELVTNYGEIGVLWFDGEWESTWTHAYGIDLCNHVRSLQPSIIVNNRVDTGRAGMEGLSTGENVGDFGTPEQQIPATGIPGVDWETCMTMNNHWGYNKNDHNWKSTEDLIRKLADIASKGGNFLLNVGPTAEGLFPAPCIERLESMGAWLKVNGEAVYGTSASPFPKLDFGRCTVKAAAGGKYRLYLHVFDWPRDGKLRVPSLDNRVGVAWMLADPDKILPVSWQGMDVLVDLPEDAPDPIDTVVVLEVYGKPIVITAPTIKARSSLFIESRKVRISTEVPDVQIRYTLDGRTPSANSAVYREPVAVTRTAVLKARLFRDNKAVSGTTEASFQKVDPLPAKQRRVKKEGLKYAYYEGTWDRMPDFKKLAPKEQGIAGDVNLDLRKRDEYFALRFEGLVLVPETALYRFYLDSDDGSRLYIGEKLVVDNDGLHGAKELSGEIALKRGLHPVVVEFFQKTGGKVLKLSYSGPVMKKRRVPAGILFH